MGSLIVTGVMKGLIAFETSAINSRHGATFPEHSNLQQYPLQKFSLEYITLLLSVVKSFFVREYQKVIKVFKI